MGIALLITFLVISVLLCRDAAPHGLSTGGTVFLTPGDYRNIKITTPEDLLVAEAFAAAQDNAPG